MNESNNVAVESALADLVRANRILANEGVMDGFGHVSIRHPADPGRYILSRSLSPELVTRDDLMEFSLDDRPVDPRGRSMYAERAIHGGIYRARPEVNAVVHNHSTALIPFGVTGMPLRAIFHMGAVIGSEVPIWDSRPEFGDTNLLVTDHEKGMSLAKALGPRRAALMRGHGCVVTGESVREAVFVAVYMQANAELVMRSRSLGEVNYLSDGEIRLAADHLFKPLSQDRAWEYWSRRAGCA